MKPTSVPSGCSIHRQQEAKTMAEAIAKNRNSTVMRTAPLVTGVLMIVFAFIGTHQDGSRTGPSTTDTADKVLAYFQAHQSGGGNGAFSLLLAAIFGMFFYGLVRDRLVRSGRSEWLATVGFGGAVILAVAALIEAGVDFAFDDLGTHLNATTAQILNLLQSDLNQMMVQAGLTVLMVGFGLALLRSDAVGWLGWPTIVIGVLASAGPLVALALPLEGVWILLVGVMMLTDNGRFRSTAAGAVTERVDAG
jgi:hypothetical protein